MVKTNVRFLALSLLIPALAHADVFQTPTQRDISHLASGVMLGLLQEASYTNRATVTGLIPAQVDVHAAAAGTKSYILGDGAIASFFGRTHVEFVGPFVNSVTKEANTAVTLRDQWYRTVGQVGAQCYQAGDVVAGLNKATSSIDPFLLVGTAQYLWKNRAAYMPTVSTGATVVTPGTGHGVAVAAAVEVKAKK